LTVFDVTVSCRSAGANPSNVAVRRYCPAGTAANTTSPCSFVVAICVHVDVVDLIVTATFGTVRFCSSTVDARTDPNTCALTVRADKRAVRSRRQVSDLRAPLGTQPAPTEPQSLVDDKF
jgi:hypothetical protein